jgi:hypothetical protein
MTGFEVYYESIKREPKIRGINKCRCDERLQTKTKEFTRLPYTGLVLELEHVKLTPWRVRLEIFFSLPPALPGKASSKNTTSSMGKYSIFESTQKS